jgi:hypothetical protein
MNPLMNLKLTGFQLPVLREEMKIGSASDTAEVEDETPQDTESKTPVPIRRSVRERRQPAWLTSGQYDVSKSTTVLIHCHLV